MVRGAGFEPATTTVSRQVNGRFRWHFRARFSRRQIADEFSCDIRTCWHIDGVEGITPKTKRNMKIDQYQKAGFQVDSEILSEIDNGRVAVARVEMDKFETPALLFVSSHDNLDSAEMSIDRKAEATDYPAELGLVAIGE